jgi:hypothetical protein
MKLLLTVGMHMRVFVCVYKHLGERRVTGLGFIMSFPKMTVDSDMLQYWSLFTICSFLFAEDMS